MKIYHPAASDPIVVIGTVKYLDPAMYFKPLGDCLGVKGQAEGVYAYASASIKTAWRTIVKGELQHRPCTHMLQAIILQWVKSDAIVHENKRKFTKLSTAADWKFWREKYAAMGWECNCPVVKDGWKLAQDSLTKDWVWVIPGGGVVGEPESFKQPAPVAYPVVPKPLYTPPPKPKPVEPSEPVVNPLMVPALVGKPIAGGETSGVPSGMRPTLAVVTSLYVIEELHGILSAMVGSETATPPPPHEVIVKGVGVSSGWAVGDAYHMVKPGVIPSGGVLVVEHTTPDWIDAIVSAGAVVTHVGGMLSHAAVVCRELGKPCVTGVKMLDVPKGQILVDGGAGVVGVCSHDE